MNSVISNNSPSLNNNKLWCSQGEMRGTPFPEIFFGNAVPPNNIRKSGNDNTVAEFGKLILRKIIKIAAIRCHILKQKCTKFDSGWGSETPLGKLTAGGKGPTSKVREGRERREGRARKREKGKKVWID